MKLTSVEFKTGMAAGILGMVQGTAWVIMSLICIILYNTGITFVDDADSYMDAFNRGLYNRFLNKDIDYSIINAQLGRDFVLIPDSFTILMWFTFLLNGAWIIISILIVWAVKNNNNSVMRVMRVWTVITVLVCGFDFIFAILVGVDFDNCLSVIDESLSPISIEIERECYDIYMFTLAIVSRGFTLWVLNNIMAIVIMITSKNIQGRLNPDYGATIPRPTLQRPSQNPASTPQSQLYSPSPSQVYYGGESRYPPQSTAAYPPQNTTYPPQNTAYPPQSPGYSPQSQNFAPQNSLYRWPNQIDNDGRAAQSPYGGQKPKYVY